MERPCLVAVGAEDVVTPPEGARRVHAILRKPLGFHAVRDAGHALPQEEPAFSAAIIESLVRSASESPHD